MSSRQSAARSSLIQWKALFDAFKDLHRLAQGTQTIVELGLEEGGWVVNETKAYAATIQSYAIANMAHLPVGHYDRLNKLSTMLSTMANEFDDLIHTPNQSKQYIDKKMLELEHNGECVIVSGNNGHATIVYLYKDTQGDYICATYNAGEEGVWSKHPNGEPFTVGEDENKKTADGR